MNKIFLTGLMTLLSMSVFSQNPEDYVTNNGKMASAMLPESADDPTREWSYNPKSTTVIGVPFTSYPVQVTFDGSIYTGESELCFFFGEEYQPMMAFQKTFYRGWIPIVEYGWTEDGIQYDIEMFGNTLPGEDNRNSIQFVQVSMKNVSEQKKKAFFTIGTRSSGLDHRMGHPGSPDGFHYQFTDNAFIRNQKVVYLFDGFPEKYAVKNQKYTVPFSARDLDVKVNTVVGLVQYGEELEKGETVRLTFKFLRVPVDIHDEAFLNKLKSTTFADSKTGCIDFWEKTIEGKGHFVIPEERVEDSFKACLVHLMLATRTDNGVKRQGSGLPYDGIFFNDFIDMRLAYDVAGHADFVEINFPWMFKNINAEGLFVDPSVSHSREIMTSHGQVLFSLCNHFMYRKDWKLAEEVFEPVAKAVKMIENDHKREPNGLVRPSIPFDAEMIQGYYTSHNLWCLLGLRSAITLADSLGKDAESKEWRKLEASYHDAILKGIDASVHSDGYVPTGLYEFSINYGGFKKYQMNQDWENMLLVYPTETLETDDWRVVGTLNHIRKTRYREGIMTYRYGMHLHQYATTNMANQYLAINDQKKALLDLYHILLHNGSTHEGFENMVEPWSDRDPDPIPAPHAWAAAKTALLIRNMLVREYGGKAGMEKNDRSLYLFSCLSPEWIKAGNKIEIIDILSDFGKINAKMTIENDGAALSLACDFYNFSPKSIYITVPFYKDVTQATSDCGDVKIVNGYMVLPDDAKTLQIKWKDNQNAAENHIQNILLSYRTEPGFYWENYINGLERGFLTDAEKTIPRELLSFHTVKKAFLMEYDRRKTQYLEGGKELLEIKAPPMQ